MLVTLVISAAFLVAATLLLGVLFTIVSRLARANMPVASNFLSGFLVAAVAGGLYGLVLKFADNTSQPLMNTGFFIAVAVGAATAFFVIMKSFDVETSKVPLIWIFAIVGLLPMFYLQRTEGHRFRESHGYYRGYEGTWSMNMPDPPEAMASPEAAVNYYNAQLTKLRNANEEEGMGKILTTASHKDLQWFNDQYEIIMRLLARGDVAGLTTVVNQPHARKGLALTAMVKPIVGNVTEAKTSGNDALVKMDSGQVVHLTREGANWKVRNWLGMRTVMMDSIRPIKESDPNYMTAEDTAWYGGGAQAYEVQLKQLCQTLGIEYVPFDPMLGEDPENRSGAGLLSAAGAAATGNPLVDNAAPGTLVDLSQQPTPTPVPTPIPTPIVTPAAMVDPATTTAAILSALPATPAPMNYLDPAMVPMGTPPPVIQPLALPPQSVDDLWKRYDSFMKKVREGDLSAPAELRTVMATDDVMWFEANAEWIAALLTPAEVYTDPAKMRMVALQGLARNMPDSVGRPGYRTVPQGWGAARIRVDGPDGKQEEYITPLALENGRWLMTRFFFARDFVWTPQLATYKQAKQIQPGPDEMQYLSAGVAPFQDRARQILQAAGYEGK
jgi:hypothetical protein